MSLVVKKRGRPSNAEIAARQQTVKKVRSDSEVLSDLSERFTMLRRLTQAAIEQNIRALVVTGAPGVGKSYNIEDVLTSSEENRFEIVKGSMSPVNLYKLGWDYRRPGNVIVLDDADSIFTDEEALNLLKALCDSSKNRRVSWMKESALLKEEDIPQSYDFQGSFIFVSNIDWQRIVDMGGNKFVPHFQALMSRALYLDLTLHDRHAISLWVTHVATSGKLFEREGVPDFLRSEILQFIQDQRDDLRELSLRTLMKAIQLAKGNPRDWKRMATVLLCRT